MTQAITLASILRRNGHEVVEVLVGACSNRELPQFFSSKIGAPITRYKSPALDYGRKGRKGKIWLSIFSNTRPTMSLVWLGSMNIIAKRIERTDPDVVVNFYEMLMGPTAMLYQIKAPIVSIAHQFLLSHSHYEHRPANVQSQIMMTTMNRFCSNASYKILALSLYPLPRDRSRRGSNLVVVPPLLRPEIFELEPTQGDFILGYMLNPAFLDEVLVWKRENPSIKVHLFWDKRGAPEVEERVEGLWLHRIDDRLFIELMASSAGYVTTAGFESVCEALYLGKPVMMIPAHIEQQINAADAESVGAGIISAEFDISKLSEYIPKHKVNNKEFREWVESAEQILLEELTNI